MLGFLVSNFDMTTQLTDHRRQLSEFQTGSCPREVNFANRALKWVVANEGA